LGEVGERLIRCACTADVHEEDTPKASKIVSNRIIYMNVGESQPDKQQVIGERTRISGDFPFIALEYEIWNGRTFLYAPAQTASRSGSCRSPQGRIERAFSVFSARMEVLTVDIACEALR